MVAPGIKDRPRGRRCLHQTLVPSATVLILRCERIARGERISRSLDAMASLEGRTWVMQGMEPRFSATGIGPPND
ncbi:hypothetical protein C8P69_10883 [Phreatobacter oligotrophus]|uniref:Uncharacterized protein n=1 Tax=Phreatobacter oligotrophus TaxID=1122261 RepID=A0A2T4YZB0_9HYPH|nr:hypothetical protein C8P69_10883 [Phreatobacter oligotrophus]